MKPATAIFSRGEPCFGADVAPPFARLLTGVNAGAPFATTIAGSKPVPDARAGLTGVNVAAFDAAGDPRGGTSTAEIGALKETLEGAAAFIGAPTGAVTEAQDVAAGAFTGAPQAVQNRRPGAMTAWHTAHSADGDPATAELPSFVPHDVQNDVPSDREALHFWQTITFGSFPLLAIQLTSGVPELYFCPQIGRSGVRVVTDLSKRSNLAGDLSDKPSSFASMPLLASIRMCVIVHGTTLIGPEPV